MRFFTALTAALLPATVLSSQVPMIERKNKLSKVISESRYLALHKALCEIPSVTNKEYEVGRYLVDMLESHHFKVITQEIPQYEGKPRGKKGRFNIYAYPDSKHYGNDEAGKKMHPKMDIPYPKVLVTSHFDTVPPHFPYSLDYKSSSSSEAFNRSNVLIKGRGTVDDKASVAAQITAVMELLISPPEGVKFSPSDLALLLVVDEETGGMGVKHFSNSSLYKATNKDYKAIVFGEPTDNKLVTGHKGIFMLRIDAKGQDAHSGYPWLGRSANSMILPALLTLDRLQYLPLDDGGLPTSDRFGNTTINIGLIQGGAAANVIPAHAHAEIAFRLGGGTLEQNQDIVKSAVAKADPDGELELSFSQGYGPVKLDADADGFEKVSVNYGTDVPNLEVAKGVKRYLYGPGTIFVAHGSREAITVGELEAGLDGFKRLIAHALSL